jgi:hypothetical protein
MLGTGRLRDDAWHRNFRHHLLIAVVPGQGLVKVVAVGNIEVAGRKEVVWSRLQSDFRRFRPDTIDRVPCPLCGRMKPSDQFTIEHILPQNTVKLDPEAVRDPAFETHVPKDTRAQTTLLCGSPLLLNGTLYPHGCNGLKGRLYDREITRMLDGKPKKGVTVTQHNALKIVGYLAMFSEFGYAYSLSRSGVQFRRDLIRNRDTVVGDEPYILAGTILGSDAAAKDFAPDHTIWRTPFAFSFEGSGHYCVVVVRSYAVMMPLSHDPRRIAASVPILPTRLAFHPDFTSFGK